MKKTSTTKPPRLNRREGLYLKNTKTKGRGVFCTKRIKKDEEIEMTSSIVLNERETELIQKTIMRDYIFTLGKISKSIKERTKVKDTDEGSCIITGMMTYCNHDEEPNAQIVWEEKGGSVYHTLIALKNIPANTEICTSYGTDWFKGRKHRSN
jgi:SET domain-containing protein